MKNDFARRKESDDVQVIMHLPDDGRVVGFNVSAAKKVRHVVYELAEAYQIDLEAFSLKLRGAWLNDYKSLAQNGVRSGDELHVELKHRALHQQKHFALNVIVLFPSGTQRWLAIQVDPFTRIDVMRSVIAKRITGADVTMDLMFPILLSKPATYDSSSLVAGIFLDTQRTFSSYGLAEASCWLDEDGEEHTKPVVMGYRDELQRFQFHRMREADTRVQEWLDIVRRFPEFVSSRPTELRQALVRGVPGCLRGRVWELLLFNKPFSQVQTRASFDDLADGEVIDEAGERILDQIGNDLGNGA